MAVLMIEEEVFKSAARVTAAFLLLLTSCLLWQGLTRVSHQVQVSSSSSCSQAEATTIDCWL
jgi:hypothetical protein